MPPILHPPPAWTTSDYSRHVVLWHGCLRSQLRSIRHGIDPTKGDPATDFGRGFYTSTVVRQARHWAWTTRTGTGASCITADRVPRLPFGHTPGGATRPTTGMMW
jgi:hypothetical protein